MTDRIRTLSVLLEKDLREDDVRAIVDAIKMVRCVETVELGEAVQFDDHIARGTAQRLLGEQVWELITGRKS